MTKQKANVATEHRQKVSEISITNVGTYISACDQSNLINRHFVLHVSAANRGSLFIKTKPKT
jgi:hypothetical protein